MDTKPAMVLQQLRASVYPLIVSGDKAALD